MWKNASTNTHRWNRSLNKTEFCNIVDVGGKRDGRSVHNIIKGKKYYYTGNILNAYIIAFESYCIVKREIMTLARHVTTPVKPLFETFNRGPHLRATRIVFTFQENRELFQ